ncbi:MAG: hypothetical protein Q7T11_05865 [Deltaproteobacteria bacterium]|nr:hypothetical protein [Deltaproteobacteria bacterium]
MKPVTEKVLQRFGYERVLLLSGITHRRVRITLPEIMEAGVEKPRVFIVLPAVLLHKPGIIYRLERDLPRYPELRRVREIMEKNEGTFLGMEIRKCAQAAQTYRRYLRHKRENQKSVTMNLRLSPEEAQMLQEVSQGLQIKNASETLRALVRLKATELNLQKGDWQ